MKSKCCRSLPRCATCPVVMAARSRAARAPQGADLFPLIRGESRRELPACVLDALAALDRRRLGRDGTLSPSA
jgi:hypothetical protein